MTKKEVAEFFNNIADTWDENTVREQAKIDRILDAAQVSEGKTVLDVACGTGVLIPDYINRKVCKCIAVDISQRMIDVASKNFIRYENVRFICADAEKLMLSEKVDCIVIYNAFPHFVDRQMLFKSLDACLKPDGRITVAHSMSRQALIKHHSGSAKNISTVLPEADEMAEIMNPFFDADIRISTDEIYIVSAKRHK